MLFIQIESAVGNNTLRSRRESRNYPWIFSPKYVGEKRDKTCIATSIEKYRLKCKSWRGHEDEIQLRFILKN